MSGLDPVQVSVAVRDKGGKRRRSFRGPSPCGPWTSASGSGLLRERADRAARRTGGLSSPEEWIEGQTATFKTAVSPAKAVTWEWSVYGPGKISLASWDTASVILNGTGSLTVTVVAKVGGKEAGRAEVTLP